MVRKMNNSISREYPALSASKAPTVKHVVCKKPICPAEKIEPQK
jgi:hypothetical protein